MNILKIIRRPYLAIFLSSLILFISCNGNELIQEDEIQKSTGSLSLEGSTESMEFDFSFYETHKGNLLSLDVFNVNSECRLESNNIILDEINSQLGTNLDYTSSFKELKLDSIEAITEWGYDNEMIDEIDMPIIIDFHDNLVTLELSEAMVILEEDVYNANLPPLKVKKFEYLANIIKLVEYEEPGVFTQNGDGCAEAVVGLTFAFAALVAACNPPAAGATVGIACYLAGANFVRASIAVGNACGDDGDDC